MRQLFKCRTIQLLGLSRRIVVIKYVPGDEHDVNILFIGNVHYLVYDLHLLFIATTPF